MVKQQKKNKFSAIPRQWKIIGFVSLSINVIILFMIIVMAVCVKSGILDYAIVNTGYDKMCSDEFRSITQTGYAKQGISAEQQKLGLAYLDYQCLRNGAEDATSLSFNDYAHSLGLKTE